MFKRTTACLLIAASFAPCAAAGTTVEFDRSNEQLIATFMPTDSPNDILIVARDDGIVRLAPASDPSATVTGPADDLFFRRVSQASDSNGYEITRNGIVTEEFLLIQVLDDHWMRLVYDDPENGIHIEGALHREDDPSDRSDSMKSGLGPGSTSAAAGPSSAASPQTPFVTPPTQPGFWAELVDWGQRFADGVKAIVRRKGATTAPQCVSGSSAGCSITGSGLCSNFNCQGSCIPCIMGGGALPTGCNCH